MSRFLSLKLNPGASYRIVRDVPGTSLVLQDLGPWDQHLTITNDAENVVTGLVALGKLTGGRRLFYYDGEGELTELVVKDGRFSAFAFVPPGREP